MFSLNFKVTHFFTSISISNFNQIVYLNEKGLQFPFSEFLFKLYK